MQPESSVSNKRITLINLIWIMPAEGRRSESRNPYAGGMRVFY